MTTPLFDPPKIHELPLSRHADLYVVFNRKIRTGGTDDAPIYAYEDWPAGVTGTLHIDTKDGIEIPAEFTGYHAIVWLQSQQSDLIRSGVTWAFRVSYPSTSGSLRIDKVPVNGETYRYDGRLREAV